MPKIVSRNRMGYIGLTFHWFMICCTCGLWYPIYASRRRARSTITYAPAGYAQPPTGAPQPPPYGYQPPPQYGPRR